MRHSKYPKGTEHIYLQQKEVTKYTFSLMEKHIKFYKKEQKTLGLALVLYFLACLSGFLFKALITCDSPSTQ